ALDLTAFGGFVLEDDPQALVQVAGHLEPVANQCRIEFDLRKDRGIGTEIDGGAGAACRPELLERSLRHALAEALLPCGAVATDGRHQFSRQRVDDRGTHTVQPARRLVVLSLELAARVQRREDDFDGTRLRLRMLVDGHPAPVVLNRDRRTVLVQHDGDVRGMAVHRLVDGVVEDLPDEMVETGRPDSADVHAGPAANRLQSLEYRDVFRCVTGHDGNDPSSSGTTGTTGPGYDRYDRRQEPADESTQIEGCDRYDWCEIG